MNKTKSTFEFLECSYSEETFSIDKPQRLNPKNGKPLLARYNLDKAIKTFNNWLFLILKHIILLIKILLSKDGETCGNLKNCYQFSIMKTLLV